MNFDVNEWDTKTNEICNKHLMKQTKRLAVYIEAWIQKAMIHHNKTIDEVELEQYYLINLPPKYVLIDKQTKKILLEIIPEEQDNNSNIAMAYNAEIKDSQC